MTLAIIRRVTEFLHLSLAKIAEIRCYDSDRTGLLTNPAARNLAHLVGLGVRLRTRSGDEHDFSDGCSQVNSTEC